MDKAASFDLRAALRVGTFIALTLVVVETTAVAVYARAFVLSPVAFGGAQVYDHAVRLLLRLPGGEAWLHNGVLDRFVAPGWLPKLWLAAGLFAPNLLVGVVLALLAESARWATGGRWLPSRLWTLVALGLLLQGIGLLAAVPVPNPWDAAVIAHDLGLSLFQEAAALPLASLLAAGVVVAGLERLERPRRQLAVAALATLLVGLAAAAAGTASTPSAAAPPPPAAFHEPLADNVILISIDSLRADHLGAYGHPRPTSPTMDRLAREGVRFSDAMSTTSWTLPAHVSMLTGLGVLSHDVITQTDHIPPGVPALAETLRDAGLVTKAIVSAPFLSSRYGFARGFDDYDDYSVVRASAAGWSDEPAPVVTDLAGSWLRANAQKRFFLFLHYWDVHYDYIPPPPYDTMFDPDYAGDIDGANFYFNPRINRYLSRRDLDHLLALYDGEIRRVDDHLARLLALLDELGIAGRTAVVLTADHGDEFFEHGNKGHRQTLYREVTQVPLIVRSPGIAAGQVVDAPVSLVDVTPTVLDLAGVTAPARIEGISLVPAMRGQPLDARRAMLGWLCAQRAEWRSQCIAMRYSDAGALISGFQPLELEFYAPSDRPQQHDLAVQGDWPRQEQLTALARDLDAQWQARPNQGAQRETVKIDDDVREQLRQLGYMDD